MRPLSKVRLFTVIGGPTGTATGFFLTIWTSLKWELVTGGKAPVSIPPFIIIAFELTILLSGLATLLAVLILGRSCLRSSRRRPTTRASRVDRFGVAVACAGREGRTRWSRALLGRGAEEVRR